MPPRLLGMTVPFRTFLALGLGVGLLGAGYVFAPHPGSAALPAASAPKAAPVAEAPAPIAAPVAAPTVKVTGALPSRPPVPLVTRTHDTYYQPKQPDASVQTASATSGGTTAGDLSTASLTVGGGTDGGMPPPADGAKPGDSSRAKAAIELDGYKNVRGLEKGPDGVWRGKAMRGRTEIAIRVDDSGNVSAD